MKAKSGFRPFRIKGGDKQVKKYLDSLREQIVQAVNPLKIILFGSYAYGQPHEDSDIDLLVIMPFEGSAHQQAFEIRRHINSAMPMDLMVRTPEFVAERLAWGDSFMREVVEQGKTLYEAEYATVGG
jgi:predicted nucleotidyltransferase